MNGNFQYQISDAVALKMKFNCLYSIRNWKINPVRENVLSGDNHWWNIKVRYIQNKQKTTIVFGYYRGAVVVWVVSGKENWDMCNMI